MSLKPGQSLGCGLGSIPVGRSGLAYSSNQMFPRTAKNDITLDIKACGVKALQGGNLLQYRNVIFIHGSGSFASDCCPNAQAAMSTDVAQKSTS